MKIAVIAANGKAGQKIVEESVRRGHDVTAIVRSENKTKAEKVLVKDLFGLTKEDLTGFDAVVTAFAAWTEETFPQHRTSLEHLAGLLENTDTHFLVVGGAGSLYLDLDSGLKLLDSPEMPKDFLPLAKAEDEGLERLRQFNQVNWTYVSPALNFDPEGEKTGNYLLAGQVFTVNEAGQSYISYADYASAILDLAESDQHAREHVSVVGQ